MTVGTMNFFKCSNSGSFLPYSPTGNLLMKVSRSFTYTNGISHLTTPFYLAPTPGNLSLIRVTLSFIFLESLQLACMSLLNFILTHLISLSH